MACLASASLRTLLLLLCPYSLLLKRMWQRAISVEWIFNTPSPWLIHAPQAYQPCTSLLSTCHIPSRRRSMESSRPRNNFTFSQRSRGGKTSWSSDLVGAMSARREVIDICYPVHLLNIILPFNSFDRNCFPPCQSQLVEGSRDWTCTGGQEYRNYWQRREGGGASVSDVWCDVSDSAGSAFKRGPCDAVTLTEPRYQLDSSEHEWLRKLLSGSEWRFIITTSFRCPLPPPHSLPLRPVVRDERRRRGTRESQINHLSLQKIRLLLDWRSLGRLLNSHNLKNQLFL